MVESSNPEIRERLRALCNQITVAEEIDHDIQEELLTHMEDKLNAYLHGAEPVTEEDAFILVREHFGDPAVVKALMQHTHVTESGLSLARRLAAIAAVSMGCTAGLKAVNIFCTSLLVWAAQRIAPESALWVYVWSVQNMLLVCAGTVLIWAFAHHWHRQIDRGLKPWFMLWPRRSMIRLILGLGVMLYLVPSVGISGVPYGNFPTVSARMLAYTGVGVASIAMIAQAMAWLWWCDRPPRTKRTLSYATLTWALAGACGPMSATTFVIATQETAGFITLLNLGSNDTQVWGALALNQNPYSLLQAMGISFIMLIVIGYAGRALYWLARRHGRKLAGPALES